MGISVAFHGANGGLGPAPGTEDHVGANLPVFRNGYACVSCWQLTPEELAEVNRTGRVYLSLLSGATQPPCFVGSEATAHRMLLILDMGKAFEREPPAPDNRAPFERLVDEMRPAFAASVAAHGDSEQFIDALGPALWLLMRDAFRWADADSLRVACDDIATSMKTSGIPWKA